MPKRKYTISDGKLVLTIEPDDDGWMLVRSPTDPAMITEARTIPQAFEAAADAFAELAASRADPNRWNLKPKSSRRRTA